MRIVKSTLFHPINGLCILKAAIIYIYLSPKIISIQLGLVSKIEEEKSIH